MLLRISEVDYQYQSVTLHFVNVYSELMERVTFTFVQNEIFTYDLCEWALMLENDRSTGRMQKTH